MKFRLPQGSMFGPLLIIFYINAMPLTISNYMYNTDINAGDFNTGIMECHRSEE